MVQLREARDDQQVGVGDGLGVGEREAAQGGDVLDERDAGDGLEAFAELQGFQRELSDGLQGLRSRFRRAKFEPLELGELGQMRRASVGELGVREAEAFEVGQVIAELAEAFVVDGTTAMAHACHLGEALELGVGLAGHLGADERKVLEILEAGELRHAGVGEFTVVGKAEDLEVRELADGCHPFVVKFGRDDVE